MNKQPFNLRKFYGNEHILEIETELIAIDIHFNKIEINKASLFLYRTDEENKYPTFHGYILRRKKNEELVKAIVKYCERNMIPIKGEKV